MVHKDDKEENEPKTRYLHRIKKIEQKLFLFRENITIDKMITDIIWNIQYQTIDYNKF